MVWALVTAIIALCAFALGRMSSRRPPDYRKARNEAAGEGVTDLMQSLEDIFQPQNAIERAKVCLSAAYNEALGEDRKLREKARGITDPAERAQRLAELDAAIERLDTEYTARRRELKKEATRRINDPFILEMTLRKL